MTFKHIKFEDSPVMRLLERQASKLGVVPDPIVKEASAEINLTPSDILIKNIVNLCAGLKAAGFAKHANELENKFFAFKQAQTLYETSKETGEDLVDEAHPKGSAKLDGLDGELALVETIIDQQLKAIKMTEKSPTGKLASSRDVLKAVKLVLGQETKESYLLNRMRNQLQKASADFEKAKAIFKADYWKANTLWAPSFDDAIAEPTLESIEKIKSKVNNYFAFMKPGILSGASETAWSKTSVLFQQINNAIGLAINDAIVHGNLVAKSIANPDATVELAPGAEPKDNEILNGGGSVTSKLEKMKEKMAPVENVEVTQLLAAMTTALKKLNSWNNIIISDQEFTEDDIKKAQSWIGQKYSLIFSLQKQLLSLSKDDQAEGLDKFARNFRKLLSDFEDFRQVWVG